MPKLKLKKTRANYITGSLFIVLFAALGVYLLTGSHASGPSVTLNADKGTLANGAVIKSSTSASDGQYVVLNNSTGGGTGGTGTVPANPTGPTTPSGGWTPIFGDAFNVPFSSDTFWHATTEGPFNSNELECFNPSQTSTDSSGLELTMQYQAGACHYNSSTQNLLSGTAETNNFWWENNQPGSFVFQTYAKFPKNTGETDLGFWGDASPWTATETDYFETGGWGSVDTATSNWVNGYLYMAMVGAGISGGAYSPFKNFDPSAGYHTYTTIVQANHMTMWIDGNPVTGLTNLGPGTPATTHLPVWLTYAARTCSGCTSGFTSGSRQWSTRYVAVYRDTADVGVGYANGGLAPNTTVH